MIEFKVFSRAHQVFDKMLEIAFIHILGHLTCAERLVQLCNVERENG